MKNLMTIIFLFFLQFSPSSFASYETFNLETFKEVSDFTNSVVEKNLETDSLRELLVVFDIDRTLLESIDCIGEDSNFTNGFFKFEEQVRQCPAEVTSPLAPDLINELKRLDVPVMALTARRSNILDGTLAQLEERLFISFEEESQTSLSFETAPLYSNRKKTIKFKQQGRDDLLNKTLVVKRGVAMASGANKGLALQAFLSKIPKDERLKINHIIFVDDDKRNIRNLENAFKDSKHLISILHYTEHSK